MPGRSRDGTHRTTGHDPLKGGLMTTAWEITHMGAECIGQNGTLATAAQKMRDRGVGSLPICGDEDRLHGILTDCDIVVKCIAAGRDPGQVRAADLAPGHVVPGGRRGGPQRGAAADGGAPD